MEEEKKGSAEDLDEEEPVDTAEVTEAEEAGEELAEKEEQASEEEVKTEFGEEAEAEPEEETLAPTKEEEAEALPKEKREEEEEIVEERIYTVPLGKAWIMPPRKRAPRAMRMLRSFVIKHMKLEARKETEGEEEEEPKKLVISNEVNEKVWGRGVEKPPRKIRVRAAVDKDGNVTVHLAEGD